MFCLSFNFSKLQQLKQQHQHFTKVIIPSIDYDIMGQRRLWFGQNKKHYPHHFDTND